MPWHTEADHPDCPAGRPWAVVEDDDGEVEGCHPTEDAAGAQLAALNAAEGSRSDTDPDDRLLFDRAYLIDDIEIVRGGDGRTVDAYCAVFDTPAEVWDQDGHYVETIHRGAFNRTLSRGIERLQVLYNHGRTLEGAPSSEFSKPIAVPVEMRADTRGLFTRSRYVSTPLADEVLELIRAGAIRSQSFRGLIHDTRRHPPARRGSPPHFERMEISLREYGPVPFPVYEDAAILAVRAQLLPTDPPDQPAVVAPANPGSSLSLLELAQAQRRRA